MKAVKAAQGKIYEDNVLGKLPDAKYAALDAQYAKEQESLSGEIDELEKAIAGYEQSRKSAEKFIALVDKCRRLRFTLIWSGGTYRPTSGK